MDTTPIILGGKNSEKVKGGKKIWLTKKLQMFRYTKNGFSSDYTIAILDFVSDEDKAQPEKYRCDVKLSDIETQKVFYDKLMFIYLEMPKFKKSADEPETKFDKWLYVLKNQKY